MARGKQRLFMFSRLLEAGVFFGSITRIVYKLNFLSQESVVMPYSSSRGFVFAQPYSENK